MKKLEEFYTFEFINSHFKIIVNMTLRNDELVFLYNCDLVFPYDRYSTIDDILQEIHMTACEGRMKEDTRQFLNRYAPRLLKYINIYMKQQKKIYGV